MGDQTEVKTWCLPCYSQNQESFPEVFRSSSNSRSERTRKGLLCTRQFLCWSLGIHEPTSLGHASRYYRSLDPQPSTSILRGWLLHRQFRHSSYRTIRRCCRSSHSGRFGRQPCPQYPPKESLDPDSEENKIGTKLMIASLISRMLLPTIIMAPLLALAAKYVPVSILDDPIFVIVCFLLTGAPSALQLAQICQINGVYEGVMSKLLFQSYVIWILPSTLILVMCALEVVEWAA